MMVKIYHDDHPRDGGGSSRSTRGGGSCGTYSSRITRGGSSSRHSTPLTPNPIDIRGNLKPSPC